MSDIENAFPARFGRLRKLAVARPLQFRAQAAQSFAACPRDFRKMAQKFDKSVPVALDFFLAWREDFLPQIQKARRASRQPRVAKIFADDFSLDEAARAEVIDALLGRNLAQIRADFVEKNYPLSEKKLHRLAQKFVAQTEEDCAAQIDAYVNFALYREVAREQNLAIYDSQARWPRRAFQKRRARRQVRRLLREVRARLAQISDETSQIEQQNNGLVARLFGLKIDYITVLAARQEYEKALARLSKKSAESPAKRLALYEKKTEAIRSQYLDSVPGLANLSDAQQAVKEIDSVLLAIFDLDNAQRNQIMDLLKQYRDLVRERENLEAKIAEN